MNKNPFVANKIAALDAEIAGFERQVADLMTRKEVLVAMKNALLPLLQKKQLTAANGSGAPPVNTGFRAAVRLAIKEHPNGLKPGELIQLLSDRGDLSKTTGKVKPAERVYAELYALRKGKEIVKRNGRYITSVEKANADT
jgi:hypothetical protein